MPLSNEASSTPLTEQLSAGAAPTSDSAPLGALASGTQYIPATNASATTPFGSGPARYALPIAIALGLVLAMSGVGVWERVRERRADR